MRLVLASALVLVCVHILVISSGAARPSGGRQGAPTVRQHYDMIARHREHYHDREDEPYRRHPEPYEKDEDKYEDDDEQQKPDNEEEEEESYEEQPKQQEDKKEYTAQPCPDSKHDCPTPQPPDQVKQAYLGHATFVWADLAARTARERLFERDPKQAHHKMMRERLPRKKSGSHSHKSPASPPAQPVTDSNSTSNTNSTSSVKASTTAVTNPSFALKTSASETGVGFSGTRDIYRPTEALAVTTHPVDPDIVVVLHAVVAAADIFFAYKSDGQRFTSTTQKPSRINLDLLPMLIFGEEFLVDGPPQAWYDAKEQRWVLVLATFAWDAVDQQPPLIVAVSQTRDPMGTWTVWALDAGISMGPGVGPFCGNAEDEAFGAIWPQATYTNDGLFISVADYCLEGDSAVSVIFAYSKAALYAKPPTDSSTTPEIYAAAYFAATAWWRSLPASDMEIGVAGGYTPYNNDIQPARPQDAEDMAKPPLFVMKVDNQHMSVATLTDCPLAKMTSTTTAPKIIARVFNKGADFSNTEGLPEGDPVIRQPGTDVLLFAGDVGMAGRNFLVRSYGAMQHKNKLYLTTSEYFGKGDADQRLPSVYWAVVEPTLPGLCALKRKDWGVVASSEGLSLAFPVIAARKEAPGAALAFNYGGAKTVSNSAYPAFAGVATALVTCGSDDESDGDSDELHSKPNHSRQIQIVKRGEVALPDVAGQNWGDFSAAQVVDGQMWFALCYTEADQTGAARVGSWIGNIKL